MTDSRMREATASPPSESASHSADGPLHAEALQSARHVGSAHIAVTPATSSPGMSQDSGLGMAGLGKTALGLALVLLLIWGLGAIIKRFGPGRRLQGQSLRIVASQSVGARERVVVVEVDDTWLVLGVAPGSINRLHEMPARSQEPLGGAGAPVDQTTSSRLTFSESFKRALSQRFDRRP
ncbi:flagellar protein FliO/FliZ [Kushneria indalinina DSM 14324]|uniref:Flagellar protein n=2 Tax=Kushneria indalinina TaxID=184067 RepID=A0A3D9E001_9GAMM|nr:flagellar protein FliO/FliZ [Kushneria indalinina DSM 14324]